MINFFHSAGAQSQKNDAIPPKWFNSLDTNSISGWKIFEMAIVRKEWQYSEGMASSYTKWGPRCRGGLDDWHALSDRNEKFCPLRSSVLVTDWIIDWLTRELTLRTQTLKLLRNFMIWHEIHLLNLAFSPVVERKLSKEIGISSKDYSENRKKGHIYGSMTTFSKTSDQCNGYFLKAF